MSTAWRTARGAATAAGLSLSLLALTGCYGQGANPPPGEREAITNGVDVDLGDADVRSLLIVSGDQPGPGRLLGTLSATGDEPVEVTIADDDDTVSVTVEPGSDYGFDTNPARFETVSEPPGARIPVTVTVGSESTEVTIPVMDGTLDFYEPYLPTP